MPAKSQFDLPTMRTIQPKILYFGTPVVLIASLNEDGSPNLAAISSAWALGWTVLLGIGTASKTFENLLQRRECVLNFPSDDLWMAVERLAPMTGKCPVPPHKQAQFRYEKDKFGATGLSPVPAKRVSVPRVGECPLQLEGRTRNVYLLSNEPQATAAVAVEILEVHVHENLLYDTNHIDPRKWRPLIYNFRHYFGLGQELGKSFRSET